MLPQEKKNKGKKIASVSLSPVESHRFRKYAEALGMSCSDALFFALNGCVPTEEEKNGCVPTSFVAVSLD